MFPFFQLKLPDLFKILLYISFYILTLKLFIKEAVKRQMIQNLHMTWWWHVTKSIVSSRAIAKIK